MAGRCFIQKLSGMSRSRSLVGAHAASRAGTLATGPALGGGITTLSNPFHGAAAHPSPTVPSIHGYEGGIKTLTDRFRGAAIHPGTPVPSNRVIQGNTASVNSVRGVMRTFSSGASTGPEVSGEAKTAAAQDGMAVKGVDDKFLRQQLWLWGFAVVSLILGIFSMSCVQVSTKAKALHFAVPVAAGC